MRILILESSTNQTLLAISDNGRLLCSKEMDGSHAMLLELQRCLKEQAIHPDAFNCIVIGTGPGSYVGLRVSASIAKSLSYSHQIPLVGICSLRGFLPESDGPFLAISDARIKGAYVLEGEKKKDVVVYRSNAELCSLEQLQSKIATIPNLVGSNLSSLQQAFETNHPNTRGIWHQVSFNYSHFISQAQAELEKGHYSLDGSLELLYL